MISKDKTQQEPLAGLTVSLFTVNFMGTFSKPLLHILSEFLGLISNL